MAYVIGVTPDPSWTRNLKFPVLAPSLHRTFGPSPLLFYHAENCFCATWGSAGPPTWPTSNPRFFVAAMTTHTFHNNRNLFPQVFHNTTVGSGLSTHHCTSICNNVTSARLSKVVRAQLLCLQHNTRSWCCTGCGTGEPTTKQQHNTTPQLHPTAQLEELCAGDFLSMRSWRPLLSRSENWPAFSPMCSSPSAAASTGGLGDRSCGAVMVA